MFNYYRKILTSWMQSSSTCAARISNPYRKILTVHYDRI